MSDHRYPALGFDPAPGDCWAIGRLSREADRVADELFTATVKVEQLGAASWCWRGDAAVEFGTALGELPRSSSTARRAFRVTAMALMAYRDALLDLQAEGRRAEADAEGALQRLHAATGGLYRSLDGYRYTRPPAGAESVALLGGPAPPGTTGGAAAELAQRDLDEARAWGRRIAARAVAEAEIAAHAARRATESAPPVPGLLQRLHTGLGDTVRNNPELLTAIADAATVVALLALFVPGVALVAGAVALLATGALAAYADGSATDVALAAVGVVPGVLAIGAAGKALTARNAATGLAEKRLPSLLTSGSMPAGEAPWRFAKLQLDQASLGMSVYGVAGVVQRRRGRTPLAPPTVQLPGHTPLVSSTAQPGRRPTPRCVDATPPGPAPRVERTGTAPASGW